MTFNLLSSQANGFNPPNLVIAILLILVNILMFIGIQQSKAVLVLIWLIVMGEYKARIILLHPMTPCLLHGTTTPKKCTQML
jgi:hypothetical protein